MSTRFCIEDKAILDDREDSWIVKYLMEHGFSDDTPEGYHRSGPWLWVDVDKKVFRFHPRYGVGCFEWFGDVTFTGADFRAIWEIFERRRKVIKETGDDWPSRVRACKAADL